MFLLIVFKPSLKKNRIIIKLPFTHKIFLSGINNKNYFNFLRYLFQVGILFFQNLSYPLLRFGLGVVVRRVGAVLVGVNRVEPLPFVAVRGVWVLFTNPILITE
jgi:hypothetical protein